MMPPIRAFCKGWTPTGPAGTLPGTVAVWPSDRDGARATWARPAASRRRSVKVHVRVSRAEQFGNKRCPADLVVREGDHGCRLGATLVVSRRLGHRELRADSGRSP